MQFVVTLPQRQGQLIALAASYHLACPGTEINPETFSDYEHGLREVLILLESELNNDSVKLKLNSFQVVKLSIAISSTISRLKTYSLLHADNIQSVAVDRSDDPFESLLRKFFSVAENQGDITADLAEELVMLRRHLSSHIKLAKEALNEEMQVAISHSVRAGKIPKFLNKVVDLISRLK